MIRSCATGHADFASNLQIKGALADAALLTAAPRLHEALRKKFGSKPFLLESCSENDMQELLEEAAAMTPKEVRKAKFKFVQDSGCVRNFSLHPETRVFYRQAEAEGMVCIMWNGCYSEGSAVFAMLAENDDDRFFDGDMRQGAGTSESPCTSAGQPVRG